MNASGLQRPAETNDSPIHSVLRTTGKASVFPTSEAAGDKPVQQVPRASGAEAT